MRVRSVLSVLVMLALAACGSEAGAPPSPPPATAGGDATPASTTAADPTHPAGETRAFRLGLTPFPFAGTPESFLEAFSLVAENADLAVHHFDDGVPWPEALAGTPYAADLEGELAARARFSPDGMPRFVALTPIAFERNGLAPYRGAAGNQPLPAEWQGRAFDDPDVIAAYLSHAQRLIDELDPDYLVYAIEANMLADLAPEQWPAFVAFAEAVYPALKAANPGLPVFVTIQADWYHGDPAAQAAAIAEILPYTDLMALSSYGYAGGFDPVAQPDYFAAVAALAPEKPVAVAETGWPAEDVGPPYPQTIPADPAAQDRYLEWLLAQATELDMVFVTWFLPRDLDAFWDAGLAGLPNAATLRLFRDIGLLDGAGAPRPALDRWRAALAVPLAAP